jgi:6-phosphogluconolactonase
MSSMMRLMQAAGFAVAAAGAVAAAHAQTFVYVSAAEDGVINSYRLDQSTGALSVLGTTPAGKLVMPMATSPDKRHLYAVVRSLPLRVLTYAIDPSTGMLKQEAKAALPDSMAYISTDKTGRYLFTASYGGDKVAVNPVKPSGLAEDAAIQVIPTGQMAHSIRADNSNRFVYASNLGSNQILQFRFDATHGKLAPNTPDRIKVEPGNGPRHILISPDNRFLYTTSELSGRIAQFAIQRDGTLKAIGFTATVPTNTALKPGIAREAMAATATSGANTQVVGDTTPRIWSADLHMTPNGRFLYSSERTDSTLSLLSINQKTGKPTLVSTYLTEAQPRGFNIDPSGRYLVATGEKSDKLSVYAISPTSGALNLLGRYPVGHDANWVEIVVLP